MASYWYIRNANEDPTHEESYSKTVGTPSCTGNEFVCSLFATEQFISGVSRPSITPSLISEINNALSNNRNTANVKLRSVQ